MKHLPRLSVFSIRKWHISVWKVIHYFRFIMFTRILSSRFPFYVMHTCSTGYTFCVLPSRSECSISYHVSVDDTLKS